MAPSKRNCRIAQRIARRPKRARGAHTERFCSMKVAIWQVLFAAYPASLIPPDPHRNPGPGHVDHPTTRAANQLVARLNIEHQSPWGTSYAHQMEALQADEQNAPISSVKRSRAEAGRVRHRPRSLTTAGVEVRSSSRTSTSTRNPRPTPGHPHSTRNSWFSNPLNTHQPTCEHICPNSAITNNLRLECQSHLCAS